jgi:transposase
MARIAKPLVLSLDQRSHLEALLRQATLEHRVARRCRVLLLANDALGNVEIAARLDMHRNGVAKIRSRFAKHGLDCLNDSSRPGKPRTHSARTKQKVVTTVCGKPPKGLSRWSSRSLAVKLGLSKSFVHSVLQEHDLHPQPLADVQFQPRSSV